MKTILRKLIFFHDFFSSSSWNDGFFIFYLKKKIFIYIFFFTYNWIQFHGRDFPFICKVESNCGLANKLQWIIWNSFLSVFIWRNFVCFLQWKFFLFITGGLMWAGTIFEGLRNSLAGPISRDIAKVQWSLMKVWLRPNIKHLIFSYLISNFAQRVHLKPNFLHYSISSNE